MQYVPPPCATLDVESISLAGFVWADGKWTRPPGAPKNKIGLPVVGAAPYWEHPGAEILCLSYRLPHWPVGVVDRWRPGQRAARVVHCKKEPYDEYCGRPSERGNPFEIGRDGDRATVIEKHRQWMLADWSRVSKCRELVGKTIACWCAPEACHCDTLAEFAALPWPLLDWLESGGHIEFHNAMFEKLGWHHCLVVRHGWPPLDHSRVHCSMATAHVNGYPGALENLGAALDTDFRKDPDGKRLMDIFSKPRNPTKTDDRTRIFPHDTKPVRFAGAPAAPTDLFERYHRYCDTDVLTEESAAERMEPMTWPERLAWLQDQAINWRGLAVDRAAVRDCIAVLEQLLDRYGSECERLTNGIGVSQGEKLLGWIAARGVGGIWSFDQKKQPIEDELKRTDLPDDVRRVLEIRALVGSAGVKKLYAIEHRASADDRLRGLFVHHGARTGRPTGEGVQTTNLVKVGPKLIWCPDCERPHRPDIATCPWCGSTSRWGTLPEAKPSWRIEMQDHVLEIMAFRSLDMVEQFFGDVQRVLQGCIRGLFVAAPGHDLIASDYSAIEAVVAACISGEAWRIEVFRNRQDIYLSSASKITGHPLQFYLDWLEQHGENHPDRQNVGKIAELALGFGGWIGSWRAFDPDEANKTDAQLTEIITAWRAASPRIVEMWGGQRRRDPTQWNTGPWRDELYGIEGAMIQAIRSPGTHWPVGPLSFCYHTSRERTRWVYNPTSGWRVETDIVPCDWLKLTLPSGRQLTYHQPRLRQSEKRPGSLAISYMTDNTNPKYGALGWVRMDTWGSRVFENAVQAIAHDIQRHAMAAHEAAGYPIVQEVYDENVAEVPHGFGSIEEFEAIMSRNPPWAFLPDGTPWPIRASGGWRGRRYRKA